MSIICNSLCVPYITNKDVTMASITSYQCVNNSSKCSNTVSPPAFFVTVTIDKSQSPDTIYHISIGEIGGIFNLNYDLKILENGAGIVSNIPEGVSVNFPLGQGGNQSCGNPNSAVTKITLISSNNSLYPSACPISTVESPFKVDDTYTINVLSCCNTLVPSVDVIFERPLWSEAGGERADLCATLDCISTCDNVRVPVIIISGQTTITGSDMADILVTVYDKYSYEKPIPLPKTRICTVDYLDKIDLTKTVLRQCSAKMVSVVKGQGPTLYCKADFIWMNLMPTTYLATFYNLLIKYGMLKYVLSRLLYGDFNINYLLGKYNEKFLADLGHSRFCQYVTDFEDCQSDIYGFNKYFKTGNKCDEIAGHENKHEKVENKHDNKHEKVEIIKKIDKRHHLSIDHIKVDKIEKFKNDDIKVIKNSKKHEKKKHDLSFDDLW